MCFPRELRGRNKDTLIGPLPLQCARKLLYFRSPNRAFPSLGLHVDRIQAELVLLDYSVDAFIAAPADRAACVPPAAPVPHGNQQVNDQSFEKRWRRRL